MTIGSRGRSRGPAALAALAALSSLVAAQGCGEGGAPTPEPPARFEAVQARPEEPGRRFCDVLEPAGEGPLVTLPALEGPPAPSEGPRWINVWASWCAPCVEELSLVRRLEARLAEAGSPVRVDFVSVDADPAALARFREAHPDAPVGARLADPAALPALVAALHLDPGATIPIHAFVDAGGRLRCARSGSIGEGDWETIRALAAAP